MTDAPTIRASLAIEHDSIRPKAAWALETLASRRGWRLVVSDVDHARRPAAYGVEIGVGCEGSWLSVPFDAAQWQFTRAEPDATRDPLACAFWWLARVEEQLAHQSGDTGAFDEHGRFCSVAAAVAPGVSVLPVDELAHSLLGELEMHPIWPSQRACAIAVTHDIDVPWRWSRQGVRRAARAIRQSLLSGKVGAALATAMAMVAAPVWWVMRRDPWCNAAAIARMEAGFGATSTSYMIAGHHDPHDGHATSYRRVLKSYAATVQAAGGEVGLHGSYTASVTDGRIEQERAALEAASGSNVRSHRYHYLRHLPARDWPRLEACGLASDASLGYADNVGYRSGTCHPYRAWDHESNCSLNLIIIPMPLMDATLEPRYSGVSPGSPEARDLINQLVASLVRHGGGASVLWHNDKLRGIDQRQWTRCFRDLMRAGKHAGAWMAPAGEVASAWDARFPASR